MKTSLSILLVYLSSFCSQAQSVNFALKTSPSAGFVFDTIDKFTKGIILPSYLTLKVESVGTEWDLYVGTTTSVAGFFDVNNTYGASGNSSIPVNILQARVFNTSGTSQTGTSFFNLNDISNPVYVIGSAADNSAVNCSGVGTNVAGTYTSQPNCYTFRVDLKATPGLSYRAGSYSLRIDYVLIQDL